MFDADVPTPEQWTEVDNPPYSYYIYYSHYGDYSNNSYSSYYGY